MVKNLVIVESPAKAKTINRYLGKDFIVKSSVGHIRDLPKKSTALQMKILTSAEVAKLSDADKKQYKKQLKTERLYARMGIYPNRNWEAKYQLIEGKAKIVSELKQLAKGAETVYLATDLDREGEAIAWHIQQVIGKNHKYLRVRFNEITESAIIKAFEEPTAVNMPRVEAQQVRRFLDRIVGFMLSPLLWEKVARGLSAGRVQSVAVKLLVEQELKIREFVPEEYWKITAELAKQQSAIPFELAKYNNKKLEVHNKEQVDSILDQLKGATYTVADMSAKQTKSTALPPFITSTLQQAASSVLGYGVKKTMILAQKLYDAGHITYMRTDSTQLSANSIKSVRQYIAKNYAKQYLPEKANYYKGKKNSQEAHEAIRPSNVLVKAEALSTIDAGARRLYDLIWRRFVACQMAPAQLESTTVLVDANNYQFKASGKVILFDGFQKVMAFNKKDDVVLPQYAVGENLSLIDIKTKQHFTKGPLRYSEATLVKELEKKGIGRPSTYASIISTIQERGYVRNENKSLIAEKIAEIVTRRLDSNFSQLMNYNFTADLEQILDKIALSECNWKEELDKFYKDFIIALEKAEDNMISNKALNTEISCPQCSRKMQIRNASTGMFLGCSGYTEQDKDQCKKTMPLSDIALEGDEIAQAMQIKQRKSCPTCKNAMFPYIIDEKRLLHICSNNPDCGANFVENGDFSTLISAYDGPVLDCDKCGDSMYLKDGRFGKYFACNGSDCKNTRKLLKSGQPAPPKMDPIAMPELRCEKVKDHYLLRDGASGLFLAASLFPKHRESRAPRLVELRPHQSKIIEKYQFVFQGPDKSPDGDDVFVRFSKKKNVLYLRAEKNNKAAGWQAFYQNGKWDSAKKTQ